MATSPGEDPWWFVAVGAIIVLLALDVAVPVLLVAPTLSRADRVDALMSEDQKAPSARPPGLVLPLTALVIAAGLVALSGWKTYDEGQLNSWWTGMFVAAGVALLWAVLLLYLTINLGAKLAGAEHQSPTRHSFGDGAWSAGRILSGAKNRVDGT